MINTFVCIICIIMIIFFIIKIFELDESTQKIEVRKDSFITVQKRDKENPNIAKGVADRLYLVKKKGDEIVNYCHKRQIPNPKIANRLHKRWSKISKKENGIRETSINEKSAAYVLNKGDQMRMCVRKKGNPSKLEDSNTMIFVLLHELAHLMSEKYGHGEEFQTNFSFITKKAVEQGIYKYQNFKQNSSSYCGTEITNDAY